MLLTAAAWLDAAPTVVQVVPLTSTVRGFDSEVVLDPDKTNCLWLTSAAQCQHLRAISTSRIEDTSGNVGALALTQIREVIAVVIDLP